MRLSAFGRWSDWAFLCRRRSAGGGGLGREERREFGEDVEDIWRRMDGENILAEGGEVIDNRWLWGK